MGGRRRWSGFRDSQRTVLLGTAAISRKETARLALWLIVLLLVLFGIIGGVAIGKFLFLILIAAAILALFGLFSRTA